MFLFDTKHNLANTLPTSQEAILKMIENFGSGAYACVMDSFDYAAALESILPSIAKQKLERGGFLVLRPDSGNPIDTVIMAMDAAAKVFGTRVNSKGYKACSGLLGVVMYFKWSLSS